MRSAIALLFAVFIPCYTVFPQKIYRLDNSAVTAEYLTANIERLMKAAHVTGMVIAVFNDNKPCYFKVFGYRNAETGAPMQTGTENYGASLSKAIFSVLVMKLAEENKLDLDKPLQEYLPKPFMNILRKIHGRGINC